MAKYGVFLKPTTLDRMVVVKTTVADPADSDWASQDGEVDFKTIAVKSLWYVEVGGVLYIATQQENGRIAFHEFATSSDTYTTKNETVAVAGDTNFDVAPAQPAVSLAVRSDGDVVVVAAYNNGSVETQRVFTEEGAGWVNQGDGNGGNGVNLVGPDSSDLISWVKDVSALVQEDNSGGSNGITGATGSAERLAQSFTSSVSFNFNSVQCLIFKKVSPTDNIRFHIETDSAGVPSGTMVGSQVSRDASTIPTGSSGSWETFTGLDADIIAGTLYWVVGSRSGARDTTNVINWRFENGTPSAGNFESDRAVESIGTWSAESVSHYAIRVIANDSIVVNSISSTNVILFFLSLVVATFDTATFLGGPGVIDSANKIYVPYIDADDQISVADWTSGASPTVSVDTSIGDNTVYGHGRTTAPFVAACLAVDGTDVHLLYANDADQDLFHDNDVDGGGAADNEELDAVTVNRISVRKGTSDLLYFYDDGGTTKFGAIALGGGAITMLAAQGSYSLSGQAATTTKNTPVVASQGSYALTGKDAITSRTKSIPAGQGAYTLNGQAANTLWGHAFAAVQGSYDLTGQAAIISRQIAITAAQGAYALTGKDAITSRTKSIPADQGSYALTGKDAATRVGQTLIAVQGAYALTGQAANFIFDHLIAAVQGSYALSGQAAITTKDSPMTAAQGAYALNGQAAILLRNHLIAAVQGSYALDGQAAVLTRQITITAVQGSYALSGQAAELKRHLVLAAQGAYALTGQAAILSRQVTIVGAQGAYTLNGQAANLLLGHLVAASQGAYALTGQAAVTTKNTPVVASQGAYSLNGQAAGLLWDHAFSAVQGSYALTGQAAVTFTDAVMAATQGSYALNGQATNLLEDRLVAAAQGSYAINGQDTLLLKGILLDAVQGSYALTGQTANLLRAHKVLAEQGSYTLTGQPVVFVVVGGAGGVFPMIPAWLKHRRIATGRI